MIDAFSRNDVDGGCRLADELVEVLSAHRLRRSGATGGRAHAGRGQAARPGALERLSRCCDSTSDAELALIARLRLARVQLEQGKADDALRTLDAAQTGRVRGALSPKCAAMRCWPRAIATAPLKAYREARGSGAGTLDTGLLDLKIGELARS